MAVRVPTILPGVLKRPLIGATGTLIRAVDEADNALVVLYALRHGSSDGLVHPGGLLLLPLISWVTSGVSRR